MKQLCLTTVLFTLMLGLFAHAPSQTKLNRGAEYRTIATMTYGRFEVRLRSAQVSGMLASFFTYYDIASPWNEIDIENMGRYSNEAQFNTIVPTQANNHVERQRLEFNPHAAFHEYAIEWTPDYVAWRVDGTEMYRQTGAHIAQLMKPQKLMMNVWQPSDANWAGAFNSAQLPAYAYYDWVRYYAYTPGTGENFTLQWTDNFDAFDATRWQKATHTWNGNNSQFVQENVAFSNGYMILCLTDNTHSGYSGGPVIDLDIDPPYLISARASLSHVRVAFSERLDTTSAQTTANYILPGATVLGASLLQDGRSVDLSVSGLNLSGPASLIVVGVKDTTGNAMSAKSIPVVMPLPFPIRIDVGGEASTGYLADSVWNFSSRYGAVGGTVVQQPGTLDIAGTTEDAIYRSARAGLTSYVIRVPPGASYAVTLMMVETKYQLAGKRVFDVKVNGSQTMRIDIFQQAGYASAWNATFSNVQAPDGMITLAFTPVTDTSLVSGIIIDRIGDAVGEWEGTGSGLPALGFSVFPNPFNGTTNFIYSLSRGGDVAITVFDILGRRVSSIPLGHQRGGEHSVRWDGQNLASGVYVCALMAEEQVLTRRVMLVK
jgi:hypothetical protein